MNPIAFQIGPFSVHWYGILVGMAMLTGYLVSRRWCVEWGIDGDKYDWLALVFLPTIIIGARTAYVISSWPYYRENPWEIIRIDHGGLGSHGAIIAMFIIGAISAKIARVPFWTVADSFGPVIPLAHIFVRAGNFVNGELWGLPTDLPWKMQFPSSGGFVHPSMLYEGIVSIPLFFLAWWWAKNRTREGHVLLRALLAQSVLRILVDYTRWRGDGIVFGMMLTQVVALVVALFCLVLLLVPRLPGQKN